MATEITPEIRQAIEASNAPPEFVDSTSQQRYVLIPAEVYERLKEIVDWSEPTPEEIQKSFQQFGKSLGWEDPSADDLV